MLEVHQGNYIFAKKLIRHGLEVDSMGAAWSHELHGISPNIIIKSI